MRKVPTIFKRNPADMRHVLHEPNPECQWVFDGEGTPTRKFDGTCVRLDEQGAWWARRELKVGKLPPPGYVSVETDPKTGKTFGWEPIEQSAFARWHQEALDNADGARLVLAPGTYELCGPKVNGNPEGLSRHFLMPHGFAQLVGVVPTYDRLMVYLREHNYEGIVWHHPDGRWAKLKKRDYDLH